jgi:hypothetical protein
MDGRTTAERYTVMSDHVFAECRAAFDAAASWREGLAAALGCVLGKLAADPAMAQLLFVEALEDPELQHLSARRRRSHVDLLAGEYQRHAARGEELPELQFELLAGALFRGIAAAVHDGRVHELPEMLDEILAAADVFQPPVAL